MLADMVEVSFPTHRKNPPDGVTPRKRPTPHIAEPERVVQIEGFTSTDDAASFAGASRTMDVAHYRASMVDLDLDTAGQTIRVECGSPDYLRLLGPRPVVGRFFDSRVQAEDPHLAVLGGGFWKRHFGGRQGVVGSSLSVRGGRYWIIGVAPVGFTGADMRPVDVWLLAVNGNAACSNLGAGAVSGVNVVGRLKTGYSLAHASAEVSDFETSTPQYRDHQRIVPIADSSREALGSNSAILSWLIGGAAAVLLVSIGNAIGLYAIHAIQRRREYAIRWALGESGSRRVGRAALETASTAGLCALVGGFTALVAHSSLSAYFLPYLSPGRGGWRLWATVAILGITSTVVSGVVPVLQPRIGSVPSDLREQPGDAGPRGGLRPAVLIGQVGFAFSLVVVSAMFWRSILNVGDVVGYDLTHTAAITLDPHDSVHGDDREVQPLRDALFRQLGASAVVARAAKASYAPLGPFARSFMIVRAEGSRHGVATSVNAVSGEYFETLGVRLLKGRTITVADTTGSAPVVVLSEEVARHLWGTTEVVGRYACLKESGCARVVGVCQSMRSRTITSPTLETFVPETQASLHGLRRIGRTILVSFLDRRTGIVVAETMSRTVASGTPVRVEALWDVAAPFTRSWRLGVTVFGSIGALAFVLAIGGVYSSLTLMVRQRSLEIGVRMALGASPAQVLRSVLAEGIRLVGAGWFLGTGVASVLVRLLRSLLFGLSSIDGPTFLAASVAFLLAAAGVCLVPAVYAARLDILRGLRGA